MTNKENKENKNKDIDEISGVETTGHEWDGLKELNNPLPRWWVWVFLVSCIWSVWYWVIYPAWPSLNDHTRGTGGYTQYIELEKSQQEIVARQAAYLGRFEQATNQEVLNDPELYAFAIAGGKSAFKDNCATCHGTGGAGGKGYPNLNDDDWLWGGTLDNIYVTLLHGIRVAGNEYTHISDMPAFGKDKTLNRAEIDSVIEYVLTLSGGDKKESYTQGAEIFQTHCVSCHGPEGKGMQNVGAPNLTDKIWLYGSDHKSMYETIYYSRAGVMPAWKNRLDDNTIRQLTIYLHQLGGGVDDIVAADKGLTNQAPLQSFEYENPELPQSKTIQAVEEKIGDEL